MTRQQINVLSHLFSLGAIMRLAKGESSAFIRSFLNEARITNEQKKRFQTIGSFFDVVFNALSTSEIRNEYIYKSALAHKRLLGVHSLNTATMLNEFRVGGSKADVVILNGTSTVYEIKSDRDSLERLASQLSNYQKVFYHTNVITSEKQVASVLAAVPENIGVLCLTKRYQISTVREAKERPELLSSVCMFDSLRRDESQAILQNIGIELPEVPNTQLYQALSALFTELDPMLVHSEMVKILKRTRSQGSLKSLVDELPRSIQAAALSTPMKQAEQQQLLDALNAPFHIAMS